MRRASLVTLLICLASCDNSPPDVACEAFYRTANTESFSEQGHVDLPLAGKSETVTLGDFAIAFSRVQDPNEGDSIHVATSTGETPSRHVSSVLYQIDAEQGLPNIFMGDTGFTGLHYVSSPSGPSELQWYCVAK